MVEITHKLDKGEEFVIERLYRASIINHNSFLMNDGIDTDAKCKTIVNFYELHISDLERIKQKHPLLQEVLKEHENVLININKKEPALDYIIRDPSHHTMFYKNKKK